MPIKLAAIVPHPPVLIPSIGKENLLQLEKTRSSYTKIGEALAEEKIETIILISSHGPADGKNFNINMGIIGDKIYEIDDERNDIPNEIDFHPDPAATTTGLVEVNVPPGPLKDTLNCRLVAPVLLTCILIKFIPLPTNDPLH